MKLAALSLLCIACSSSVPPAPPAQPSPPRDVAAEAAEAEAIFRNFEDRLARAKRVVVMARLEAMGAVTASFVGRLSIDGGERVHLDFDGTFNGDDKEVLLISDGRGMGLNETGPHAAPPALVDALIVGLARMGLLHNIVRGAVDQAPDHADGGARNWLSVDSFGKDTKMSSISYRLVVDGQPSAEVSLRFDAATGLPVKRVMVVHFPEGDMFVTESYGRFVVEP